MRLPGDLRLDPPRLHRPPRPLEQGWHRYRLTATAALGW